MPRKTRKEKIISQHRKELKLLQTKSTGKSLPPSKSLSPNKSVMSSPSINKAERYSEEDLRLAKYFSNDFKKSLFIIAFIIGLEISLYFVSINTNLKLIR